jgi:myosin heavy subunit
MAAQVAVPSQVVPPKEIELGQRNAPAAQPPNQSNLNPVQPQRCLSYEMSVLPCGTDDLVGDGQRNKTPENNKNKVEEENKRNLEEEINVLKPQLDKLKVDHGEMRASIEQQKDELKVLYKKKTEVEGSIVKQTQELKEKSELVEALKSEERKVGESIDTRKEELHALLGQAETSIATMESKKKELAAVVSKVNQKGGELQSLASQVYEKRKELQSLQSNFDSLRKQTEIEIDSQLARRNRLMEEVDQLEHVVSKLKADIEEASLQRPHSDSILVDSQSCISQATDFAATIREQKKDMEDLQKQLCHETKQRRQSERDRIMVSTQVSCLQDKISELEKTVSSMEDDRLKEKVKWEKETERIEGLESQLSTEANLRRTLEESLHIASQDYDTMAQNLNAKLGDLKDKSALETALKRELQQQVVILQKRIESSENEKLDLQLQVRSLEERLSASESAKLSTTDGVTNQRTQESETLAILANIVESPQSVTNDYIKAKASHLLDLADAAIDNIDGKSTSTLSCSSSGTNFKPGQSSKASSPTRSTDKQDEISRLTLNGNAGYFEVTNLDLVQPVCSCSSNLFASKAEYVEFYLPQITIECVCGHAPPKSPKEADQDKDLDPCALASILRPWQVEFLADQGIYDTLSFAHMTNQRMRTMSRSLREWRRTKQLPPIKTKSCGVALHIWARTCKSVLRSVRSQRDKGILVPRRPEFLELNLSENNTGISSLGGH